MALQICVNLKTESGAEILQPPPVLSHQSLGQTWIFFFLTSFNSCSLFHHLLFIWAQRVNLHNMFYSRPSHSGGHCKVYSALLLVKRTSAFIEKVCMLWIWQAQTANLRVPIIHTFISSDMKWFRTWNAFYLCSNYAMLIF